ncbi:hypothetical protein M231_02212 [Tremella mesenterica]|uniref:ATP-dependent DNA helicase n=1 Tax=Tremella mesenterica TaxID=5217 RepID=A0A4Q1BRM0_TREME|nr:hypothetical protein M231_02212 [Tremella mesenterica]
MPVRRRPPPHRIRSRPSRYSPDFDENVAQRRRQAQQNRQRSQRRRRALERVQPPPVIEVEPDEWRASEAAARRHAQAQPSILGESVPVQHARLPWGTQPLLPLTPHRHYLGRMNAVCPCCQAYLWPQEASTNPPVNTFSPFRLCCKFGRVDLQPFPSPPPLLDYLLSATGPDARLARHFRTNIRSYNNALAFMSTGVRKDPIMHTPGVPLFKIQGQLCHRIGPLLPNEGSEPRFLQVYISDNSLVQQAARRTGQAPDGAVDPDLMLQLSAMVEQNNCWAQLLLSARERLEALPPGVTANLQISTIEPWSADPRRYNKPRAKEVGAIVVEGSEAGSHRSFTVHHRAGGRGLQEVNEDFSAYLPLRFVLILPFGTHGWCRTLPQGPLHADRAVSNNTVSLRLWHAFHLFTRQHQPLSALHRAGMLFQEWVVDAYAVVEQKQLRWLRNNQAELRMESYNNLRLAIEDGINTSRIGIRTILPASHVGSPRYMYQTYQDCMAIVRFHGKPTLFLTMTSNPNWTEIREQLGPGQATHDRPDLMARVFRLKLTSLMSDLVKNNTFGRVLAWTYVVEYQKRGLPHAHILLVLHPDNRPLTAADVDSFVSAELPDQQEQPMLWSTVTSCMLHGPCGPVNPSCPCMTSGQCKSRYPRPFQDETSLGDDGYPTYRRRRDGRTVERDGFTFTNQWVVPYNPLLSMKYDCHLNVEIASAFAAVKYLFKYVYKGGDRSAFVIHEPGDPVDEISDYLDGRYISPAEACYRLFAFEISEHSPSVTRLVVHTPGDQPVLFRPTANARASLVDVRQSMLEAFFTFCSHHPDETRTLLYPDAPSLLTWHKSLGEWKTRGLAARRSIGRVVYVPHAQEERFYLRMLLYHVPSPKSYLFLRSVNGTVHATFKMACEALGLLESDREYDLCLDEAATFQSAQALRMLFVTTLIHSSPNDPRGLFDRHREDLFDDCRYRLRTHHGIPEPTDEDVEALGLGLLSRLAEQHGRSMTDLQLPEPPAHLAYLEVLSIIREERQYNEQQLQEQIAAAREVMNEEQRWAVDQVKEAVERGTGGLFFLDGPGGTGKTFVEQICLAEVRVQGKIALAVASSGVAALLLPGGRTAHSRFKIPVQTGPESTCPVSAQSALAELFRQTDLIVWDEAVMQHCHCFAAVDRMLQDCREDSAPFGGITVVFAGDLRQCLPVIPKATRGQIINATITHSSFWSVVTLLPLRQNMRLMADHVDEARRSFARWLVTVGDGQAETVGGMISLPPDIVLGAGSTRLDLINTIYNRVPNLDPTETGDLGRYFSQRVILAPHNTSVDATNQMVLEDFPGETVTALSADTAIQENGMPGDLPEEYLNSLQPSGFPLHRMSLKVGVPLLLLRNLAPGDGLCNGTRLLLVHIGRRVLQCLILGGTHNGSFVLIPRIRLNTNPGVDLPFTLSRRQFPIRLAFAMTINKAQGQSLPFAGLDLTVPCFAHGQLYVGLSRSTSPQSLKILLPDGQTGTPNIVYREVLQAAGLGGS